jgi:hypothetical protein
MRSFHEQGDSVSGAAVCEKVWQGRAQHNVRTGGDNHRARLAKFTRHFHDFHRAHGKFGLFMGHVRQDRRRNFNAALGKAMSRRENPVVRPGVLCSERVPHQPRTWLRS